MAAGASAGTLAIVNGAQPLRQGEVPRPALLLPAQVGARLADGLGPLPGTGTPESNGLTPRETFPLIRRLCAETNVVGFELVELLPYRDDGYETVLNSERIVRECLVGIAMRKKGIDERHYLSPLTADDGRQ